MMVLMLNRNLAFNDGWRFSSGEPHGAPETDHRAIANALKTTGRMFARPDETTPIQPLDLPSFGESLAYARPGFDDSAWRTLDLPHDWGVERGFEQDLPGNTGKLRYHGIGWYRKRFDWPAAGTGRRLFLEVDGAISYAAVWINGQFVGGWPYGYTSWRVELTPHVRASGNVIAIRLQNPNDSSRWYPGGGIYRDVRLREAAEVDFAHWGVAVTTSNASEASADVEVQLAIENPTEREVQATVAVSLFDERDVATDGPSERIAIPPRTTKRLRQAIQVQTPTLWDLEHRHLYRCKATLALADQETVGEEVTFGIRSAECRSDGFFLNGRRVTLNGVCLHHDLGALGAAFHPQAMARQIEKLQEMGCNAIRTSHNPPAPGLLDLCDRMGLLVIVEAFDTWQQAKTPNDYSTIFDDWHDKDVRAMVRRDRNHPCVILWSTGNEVREQGRGPELADRLRAIVREEDSSRPVTVGCDFPDAGFNGFAKGVDVFGYNYKPHLYERFRRENPGQPLYGSETASCISSRGFYVFPVSDDQSKGQADFQVSSYDLSAPPWASAPDVEFAGQDANGGVLGEFVWTGFDYLGEPTPYNFDPTLLLNAKNDPAKLAEIQKQLDALGNGQPPPSRSSYFGIFDLCGFRKDRFYLYQARWRPDVQMAHILPHWTWPGREGQVTPVHVYTSGDEAELFLNGRSLGRRKKGSGVYRLRWDDVCYEPGELRLVAYKEGEPWAVAQQKTAGPAVAVKLEIDPPGPHGDGTLSFVAARVIDADGDLVPQAINLLIFRVEGPAELMATDNGDATDLTAFASPQRKAFNGLALAIVKCRRGEVGPIHLSVEAEGLQGDAIVCGAGHARRQIAQR